jgi:hypothetical protein
MKKSRIFVIFIFVITAVLGGVAIWIGWRLSQEPEVTPETGEAAGSGYEDNYYCSDFDGTCSRSHDHYYSSKDERNTNLPCASYQLDTGQAWGEDEDGNPVKLKDGKFETRYMGPDPQRQYRRKWGDDSGSGTKYANGYSNKDQFDVGSCTSCKNIELVETTETSVTVKATSRNVGPRLKYKEKDHSTIPDEKWAYFHNDSISDFRFRLLNSDGSVVSGVSDFIIDENSAERTSVTCTKIANPTNCLKWGNLNSGQCYLGSDEIGFKQYEPEDKIYECEYTYTWDLSSTPLSGGTYMVEVSSRMGDNHFSNNDNQLWRHPDMLITGANIYYEIPYKIDTNGDGTNDDGPYTYRQLYNPSILSGDAQSAFSWLADGNNTCVKTFEIEGEASLQCVDLASDPALISITENDLTEDLTVDLSTSMSADGVDVSSTNGYTYYTNIPGAYFASDTSNTGNYINSPETTLTIPAGTDIADDYFISSLVEGTDGTTEYSSGCTSAASCVGNGEGCLITLEVGPGDCDCESITRSPSADEIAPGSDMWFQVTDACLLGYSEVEWFWSEGESGDPQATNFSDRVPSATGPEALNHSVQFSVPDDATGTICVWAQTRGVDDPDCRDCFSIGEEELPAFAAVKTSEVVCINDNTAARVTYTIHVRNISDIEGVIEYVEDTYDSRFQSSWVSGITPTPDSHSGNVIRWDNNDAGFTLAANDGASGGDDEIEFSYIVTVPDEYFGETVNGVFVLYEYQNLAVVKPEDQEPIELSTIVEITCLAIPTALFDKAVTTALLGLLLIITGGILIRTREYTYKYLYPVERVLTENLVARNVRKAISSTRSWISSTKENIQDRKNLTKKERFEKKTVKKVEKK